MVRKELDRSSVTGCGALGRKTVLAAAAKRKLWGYLQTFCMFHNPFESRKCNGLGVPDPHEG